MQRIILASESPNRRALLEQVGIPFEAHPAGIDETGVIGETIRERACRLSLLKARAVAERLGPVHAQQEDHQDTLVLGFDTLVEIDGRIVGKPRDRADARQILGELSGRTHLVTTGVALIALHPEVALMRPGTETGTETGTESKDPVIDSCTTRVAFRRLADRDFAFYLDTEEWRDAAGAYRIQGRGAFLVSRLEGSYSNVVGLPLSLIYGILRSAGYRFAS